MTNKSIVEKFESLVAILFLLGIFIGIVLIFFNLFKFLSEREYLEYASAYGGSMYASLESSGNIAYQALQRIKIGIVLIVNSIIFYYPIMSIVVLIQSNLKIVEQNEEILDFIKTEWKREISKET